MGGDKYSGGPRPNLDGPGASPVSAKDAGDDRDASQDGAHVAAIVVPIAAVLVFVGLVVFIKKRRDAAKAAQERVRADDEPTNNGVPLHTDDLPLVSEPASLRAEKRTMIAKQLETQLSARAATARQLQSLLEQKLQANRSRGD